MMRSFSYQSFCDYTVLPELREACASGLTEFDLTTLPPLHLDAVVEEANRGDHARKEIYKNSLRTSNPPVPTSIVAFMTNCHAIAADVFKNLSHVMELPWEKYLGEMHEFAAPGRDVLRIIDTTTEEPRMQWSTLTLIFDERSPNNCRVIFGEAMAVFSQNQVKSTSRKSLTAENADEINGGDQSVRSKLFVYDVRPNDGVFYTKTAGALMEPLTQEDYDTRKRVGEIDVGA